jgi:hypothetical protein
MQLLDLPPEILQQLLLHCTTPSFIQIIYTCRQLFQLSGSSRQVLLRHLDDTPGITLGLQDPGISTHDLFLEFRRRGNAHLIGANIRADRIEYKSGVGTFDANASCLSKSSMTLALKNSLELRMYSVLGASACELHGVLADSPSLTFDIGNIIKIVAWENSVSILFSRIRGLGNGSAPAEGHGCLKKLDGKSLSEADHKSPDLSETCYYIYHQGAIGHDNPTVYRISAPNLWLGRSLVPIDLAVYSQLQCVVLWDLPGSINPTIFAQVTLYSAYKLSQKPTGYYGATTIWPSSSHPSHEYPPHLKEVPRSMRVPVSGLHQLPPEPQSLPRRVRRLMRSSLMPKLPRSIAFAQDGCKIKLFAPGEFLPYDVVSTTPRDPPESEDDPEPDPFMRSATPWTRMISNMDWTMTTPFYHTHTRYWAGNSSGDAEDDKVEICAMSHLSLATATVLRHFQSGKNRQRDQVLKTKILCILSTIDEGDATECTHSADMDRCASLRAAQSRVVARLWGWQPSESSLAGESNLACCDTRIAIANWDRILVWSLSPKALIDEANDPAPPPNQSTQIDDDDDSDDEMHVEVLPEAGERKRDPAWTYPKVYDENMEGWYVELKPIILNTGKGVVIRQLIWKDTDTLLVRTDRGMQVWNVGASATGKRTQALLAMDLSSESGETDTDE